jgi:hypothetical protein
LYCKLGGPKILGGLFGRPCCPCLETGLYTDVMVQDSPSGDAIGR